MVHVSSNGEGQRNLLTFSNSNPQQQSPPEANHNNHNNHTHAHHNSESLLNSIIKTVFEHSSSKEDSFSDLLLPLTQEESTVPLYSPTAKNNGHGFNLSCVIEEEPPPVNTMTSTNILRDCGTNETQPLNGNANANVNMNLNIANSSAVPNRSTLIEDTHNSNTLNGNRNITATTTTEAVSSTCATTNGANGHGKVVEEKTTTTTTTKKTSNGKKANGKAAAAGKEKVSHQKTATKKAAPAPASDESAEEHDKVPLLASESSNRRKSPSKPKKSAPEPGTDSSPSSRTGESSQTHATSTATATEALQPTTSSVKTATGKSVNGKNPASKRVSFGNSKGTMVETLIYENPVSDEQDLVKTGSSAAEASTSASSASANGGGPGAGPSGSCVVPTTILKTTETNDSIDSTASGGSTGGSRPPSRVRVTFFESEKPLAVSSPESDYEFDLSHNMTLPGSPITADGTHSYHRQNSEIGWENPFRPDGDLSKEADQIVELIKEGKPINEENLRSKSPNVLNSTTLSFVNAKGGKGANGTTNGLEVQRGVVAQSNQPGQVEHVNLKKKKGCCVVQ